MRRERFVRFQLLNLFAVTVQGVSFSIEGREETVMDTKMHATQQEHLQLVERRLHGVALISVIIALLLTILLEALDQTIVGTAMPKIIAALQGFDRYAWVVNAY